MAWRYLCFALMLVALGGCAGQAKEQSSLALPAALKDKRVNTSNAEVAFSPYWLREQKRKHTLRELAVLEERYQKLFTRALDKAFTKQGWTIDPQATISAQLDVKNLRISAPDFDGAMVDLYAQDELGSGDFTVIFQQGETLVTQFSDATRANSGIPGQLERTNRVRNQWAFELAVRRFIKKAELSLRSE